MVSQTKQNLWWAIVYLIYLNISGVLLSSWVALICHHQPFIHFPFIKHGEGELAIILWGKYYVYRAEKSAEEFRELKFVIVPYLSFSYTKGIYSTSCRVLQAQCFWTKEHHITMLQPLEEKIYKLSYISRIYGLRHLLDRFLSCVFLGNHLVVPEACSSCSPLFSTLYVYGLYQPNRLHHFVYSISVWI